MRLLGDFLREVHRCDIAPRSYSADHPTRLEVDRGVGNLTFVTCRKVRLLGLTFPSSRTFGAGRRPAPSCEKRLHCTTQISLRVEPETEEKSRGVSRRGPRSGTHGSRRSRLRRRTTPFPTRTCPSAVGGPSTVTSGRGRSSPTITPVQGVPGPDLLLFRLSTAGPDSPSSGPEQGA